jgi:predicted RNase H-like nuclease
MSHYGVDGCPAGWLALRVDDGPFDVARGAGVFESITALWSAVGADAVTVWIDIPIGLPDAAQRAVDVAARGVLGQRRSSVFSVPVRAAFDAPDYPAACDANQAVTGKRFAKQTWNIMPKIREVDAFLRGAPSLAAQVVESHPEVVFAALNGGPDAVFRPMAYSKKHALGFLDRLETLRRYRPDADQIVRLVYAAYEKHVTVDDVVDALALSIAGRWPLKTLPDRPAYDRHHLPMQVVYPVID